MYKLTKEKVRVLCFVFVIDTLADLLRAFVLIKWWIWFIVPKFNLPMISFFQAFVIIITVSFLFDGQQTILAKQLDEKLVVETIIRVFFSPLFAWLIGWLVMMFIS